MRSGNEAYVLMDQVCLLLFLFTGIFLTDRVYGADKIPGTFFKVTGNVTCGEKGKRQIQCFTSTACCKDKDGNAVGCMNGDQICCQGNTTLLRFANSGPHAAGIILVVLLAAQVNMNYVVVDKYVPWVKPVVSTNRGVLTFVQLRVTHAVQQALCQCAVLAKYAASII